MTIDTEVLKVLPVAIYVTDADGRITFYNEAAAEFWGVRPELNSDQWCGSWRLYTPDGEPMPHDGCPMALTLKSGKQVLGEAVAERPDGTRVRFQAFPSPIRDRAGQLTGAVNLLADITERHQNEAALSRIAAIVSSSDDAIVTKTLSGRITSWNQSAVRIFGYEEKEIIGQQINIIVPPELQDEEKNILARIARGEHIDHFETVRLAKDGRRIDISLTISPLHDKTGKIIGASKVARDITEKKRSEELQRLLLGELNHRVKNTLAIVQSIATQTLRRAASPEEFAKSFSGRVQALARAHTLFTRDAWQGADVADIVREQVMDDENELRISCAGPSIVLDPQAALSLSMILHELGTNARKYGALSVSGGRLSVEWELRDKDLTLLWIERDGPLVHPPLRQGFGTMLIERGLKAHDGETKIRYEPDGVTCDIRLPAPKNTQVGFSLPMPLNKQRASSLARQPDLAGLKGKRILVIEDEPLVSVDIETILSESGFAVAGPAVNVAHARRMIETETFDGALVDANLDGSPVDELASALVSREIPFVFLTGYGRESLPNAFRHASMIEKPFTREQLVSAMGKALNPESDGSA